MERKKRGDRGTEDWAKYFRIKEGREKVFLLVITKANLRNKMTQYSLLLYLYSKTVQSFKMNKTSMCDNIWY